MTTKSEHPPKYAHANAELVKTYRPWDNKDTPWVKKKVYDWYTVRSGNENLKTIADKYQVALEKLIEFNFPGSVVHGRIDPNIVNWYLHHHEDFRCPETHDKKNRIFRNGQQIAIPKGPANIGELHPYPTLKGNKQALVKAFDSCGITITAERRALMMAMAMIETTDMSPAGRDKTKDVLKDKSANVSIFNLNEDFLRTLGYQGKIHDLDPLSALPKVVKLIDKGIEKWGVIRMLNFVRGGATAFKDGKSYGAKDYRSAVATILRFIDDSPSLMSDDRRVDIDVLHQTHVKP